MYYLVLAIITTLLAGCGVGGFQGPDNTNSGGGGAVDPELKRVSGTVSAAPVTGAQVQIYGLNSNGSRGPLLATTTSSAFGQYTSSVAITGPSLYIATGGSYSDEATGLPLAIPSSAPLRAAMDTVSPSMAIAITPLTELAVRQAGTPMFATGIASANQLVSSLFKFNIVATQPLAPTASDFAQSAIVQAQKDYALALAGLAQMAASNYGGSMDQLLTTMDTDLTNGKVLSSTTATQFQTALTAYLASSKNLTGVKDINATNLVNAGGLTLTLKLATTGQLPAGESIYGVEVLLSLPPGVTIRVSDFATYQADLLVVFSSGVFPANLYATAHYVPMSGSQPATLDVAVPQATGSPLGEFATVICDLPAGVSHAAADFAVSAVKVVDGNGAVIPGVSVAVGQ